LQLLYYAETSSAEAAVPQSITREMVIDPPLATEDTSTTDDSEIPEVTNITISWAVLKDTPPLEPGSYQAQWQIIQNIEERVSDTVDFIVETSRTVTVGADNNYREEPVWDRRFNVDGGGGQQVEAIGKRTISQEGISGIPNPRNDAIFLLVRLPGTRDLYWLGDQHTEEFNNDIWDDLLASIPDV
jgi:hypothetical protein